jgi:DUF4097 and DUF4098 domain-containing protein YvlB
METVNGSIKIKLLNPSGRLHASNVIGRIEVNTPGARDVETGLLSYRARFGDGSESMSFETVNGPIVIE